VRRKWDLAAQQEIDAGSVPREAIAAITRLARELPGDGAIVKRLRWQGAEAVELTAVGDVPNYLAILAQLSHFDSRVHDILVEVVRSDGLVEMEAGRMGPQLVAWVDPELLK
jgi:hypothetical protein